MLPDGNRRRELQQVIGEGSLCLHKSEAMHVDDDTRRMVRKA